MRLDEKLDDSLGVFLLLGRLSCKSFSVFGTRSLGLVVSSYRGRDPAGVRPPLRVGWELFIGW